MHSENNELVKSGHELAKCLDSNTPLLDIAKLLSKMAAQLDVTTAALREKTKQCEQLAAENAALKNYRPQPQGVAMMTALDAFFEHEDVPEQGMMDAFEILLCKRPETPTTDAFLRKVRAEAILFASYHLPDGGKYQDSIQALAQEVLDGYTQVSFPVQQQRQGGAA